MGSMPSTHLGHYEYYPVTKIILNIAGMILVSACVGVHPPRSHILLQCGDVPAPYIDTEGRNITQVSNLTITKIGSLLFDGSSAVVISYEGFRSDAEVLEEQTDTFRYQFNNEQGEVFEISGDRSRENITLQSIAVTEALTQCKEITFKS